ncbi:TetR/AcrR family transcriptional regulator [Krasilnikoviella flava]|uniref:Transcriptional regulator, TetR family n=1 Tax=Krasilnikoviella flava TaxID=526729 RepID=A0A1T5M2Z8_9MICO|nr:TetR/AcrR family transcriptional regulator [Krasilnikoviella flava]SKC82566.1 transcriptional regulator, TetR family [Krasilnikoviella flava]
MSPVSGARAAPMAPDDRRSAIIDAVLPLVGEFGVDVTSRELADAAGIAEGTLFRAFGDKLTLIGAVAVEGLHRASGPVETRAELAAIDREAPLEERLERVIELGRRRMSDVMRWMGVLRALHHRTGARDQVEPTHVQDFRTQLAQQREQQREATVAGLIGVLQPDEHRLRVPIEVAVALVEASIAGTHARVDQLLPAPSPRVVADALVHGIAEDQGNKHVPEATAPENTASEIPRGARPRPPHPQEP